MKKFLVLAAFASLSAIGGAAIPPAAASSYANSSAALDAFEGAWSTVTAYSATIKVFEQKDLAVQTMVCKYTFRKPSIVTVDIVEGANSGVSLLWTGGDTLTAHRGAGLLGMFKRTLPLHDPLVLTIRGSSIDQLSFGEIIAHGKETAGTIVQNPGTTIDGIATDAVTLLPSMPTTDSAYMREVIEISTTTHFPLRILGYQGTTLLRRIDFEDVKVTN